jgi:glycosyltransferase involved in cell wall biosynthesis
MSDTRPALHVVHVVASLNVETGGPAQAVAALADAQACAGIEVDVVSLDYERHGRLLRPEHARLYAPRAPWWTRAMRGLNPSLARDIEIKARTAAVVHNHGLWMQPNRYARWAAQRTGAALITSPRGMLEAWSMGRSRARKALAMRAFERRNLDAARAFHATAATEADAIRAAGWRQPIVLLPNGVALPPPPSADAAARWARLIDAPASTPAALFLSRLHPKKGLDLLLSAWALSAAADWRLIIAGRGEPEYEHALQRDIARLGLSERVRLVGHLDAEDKLAALGAAQFLVLPTRSENFGNAIAEALAHACPVLTTTAAPWPQLPERGAGWRVVPEVEAIAGALRTAMRLDAPTRRAMGERGRAWMHTDYAWPALGAQWRAVYEWLAGQGACPACVLT